MVTDAIIIYLRSATHYFSSSGLEGISKNFVFLCSLLFPPVQEGSLMEYHCPSHLNMHSLTDPTCNSMSVIVRVVTYLII